MAQYGYKLLPKIKKAPKEKRERTRLRMLPATRREIIRLRYGDDLEIRPLVVKMGIPEISRKVGHKHWTVCGCIRKFRETGVINHVRINNRVSKVTPAMAKYICSKDTLTRW